MNENRYITVKDYAKRKNIAVKTVYNRIESGVIPKDQIKTVLGIKLIKV